MSGFLSYFCKVLCRSFGTSEIRNIEMHTQKYGAIFKDITYFLKRKRNSTGGEYNVDFGNPYSTSPKRIILSPSGPEFASPIRSLLWIYSLLTLSYFFQKWGTDSSWMVLKVESSSWKHKVEWLFSSVPTHLLSITSMALNLLGRCSLHSEMFL